jgi:tetratricopeptide (TPR) repeat protein
MAKVYVSSTIADLRQERQAVVDWLVAAGHQPVHSYLPESATVRDSCLEDVDSCDLYVLILGHRYGLQPAEDNPEGLSITQLEFRRAGQSGIPRIALLRTSIPDVSLSDLADPRRLALVSAFREEVAREVRPAEFSDPQGLIQGLSTGVQAELGRRSPAVVRRGRGRGGPVLRLAPRPLFLAGREGLLAELEARLTADNGRPGPQVVALCGLGGVGKTSVALEYAHRQLGDVEVAWQFPAEDPAVLAAGFSELAAQLVGGDGGDPMTTVHGVLAASPAPWLLVFDNAPDRASVAAFVPPAGRGRVLITSRDQIWPPGQALDVPVLGPEAATEFLASRTGDRDRQAAWELAQELGGLPLALEQAGAYIQATGGTLAGYLALFRQRRPEMLARGKATGYDSTVAATWSLAFGRLCLSAPEAAGLLRLLACCAPEAIPLRALLQPRPGLAGRFGGEVAVLAGLLEDPLAAGDAVAALRRYSLVTPAADGSVLVHRLVQNVMLDQMLADLAGQWRQAAAALIEAAIPADTGLPDTWPVCVTLLPHVKAALAYDSAGMARIANYLGSSGSYAAARDLYREILDAQKDAQEPVLDPEGRDHIRAVRFELGRWTRHAGDPAAAKEQFDALLPEFERDLGPEHPDTLRTRGWLADLTGDVGDPAAARDLFAALLPVDERVLGPEHEETLAACRNLATWTGEAGDPAGARDQYAVRLPVEKRVLGPKHQATLITCANHARWTGEAGDPAAARDLLGALLPVFQDVFGSEHPRTLIARHQLARWTGQAGDPAAARDQYAALLPVHERILGQEHPHTLATWSGLAHWTGQAGDAVAARGQYAALVSVRERVLGPVHPDTLTARYELARWTGQAGDPAAARDLLDELLPVREHVLGPEHPDTLATRRQHARWTKKGSDPNTALLSQGDGHELPAVPDGPYPRLRRVHPGVRRARPGAEQR